jgi:hypothetical protein
MQAEWVEKPYFGSSTARVLGNKGFRDITAEGAEEV